MDPSERELWDAYRLNPSVENRNALAQHYNGVLIATAQKLFTKFGGSVSIEEMIQDGFTGLLQAIEGFDLERGIRFNTYAPLRIRGSIIDAVRNRDWVPRLERLRERAGEVQPKRMTSLQALAYESESGRVHDLDIPSLQTFDAENEDEFWKQVCRGLSSRERLILMLYWRLDLTMKDIGQQLGISEPRVSQAMSDILDRLKQRSDLLEPPPSPIRRAPDPQPRRGNRQIRLDHGYFPLDPPRPKSLPVLPAQAGIHRPAIAIFKEPDMMSTDPTAPSVTPLGELMTQISKLHPEEIDKEINALTERIDVLRRLKSLLTGELPGQKPSRRTKEQMQQLVGQVKARIESHGPAKYSEIAAALGEKPYLIDRLTQDEELFRRDGTRVSLAGASPKKKAV